MFKQSASDFNSEVGWEMKAMEQEMGRIEEKLEGLEEEIKWRQEFDESEKMSHRMSVNEMKRNTCINLLMNKVKLEDDTLFWVEGAIEPGWKRVDDAEGWEKAQIEDMLVEEGRVEARIRERRAESME